jgi:hypothetical protein
MARRRDDDDEDDDDLPKKKRKPARSAVEDEDDDDFDDEPAPRQKSKENAFTGLLVVSLVALIIAAVMIYFDTSELGTAAPPQPGVNVPGLGEGRPAGGQ